jgi:hypothetical protein
MLSIEERTCGSCRECCIALALRPEPGWWQEIKPAGQPCRFLNESGCSIHDQPRPNICGDFKCGYLLGQVPQRPDENGVICAYNNVETVFGGDIWNDDWQGSDRVIWIQECQENAILKLDPVKVRYWFRRLSYAFLLVWPYLFSTHTGTGVAIKVRRCEYSPFGVYWSNTPSYADTVISWWRGVTTPIVDQRIRLRTINIPLPDYEGKKGA